MVKSGIEMLLASSEICSAVRATYDITQKFHAPFEQNWDYIAGQADAIFTYLPANMEASNATRLGNSATTTYSWSA